MGSQSSVELPVENPNSDIEMKAWSFAYFAPGEEKSEGLGPLFGTGTYNMTNANALFGDFMIWRGITDFHCYVLREGTICLFCL